MSDIDDPFREGLPEFGDPALDRARDDIVAGTEVMRALVGANGLAELAQGVDALDERDARRTLLAALLALRYQLGNRQL